jgi:sugar-specific transcriptional regulator TrmB
MRSKGNQARFMRPDKTHKAMSKLARKYQAPVKLPTTQKLMRELPIQQPPLTHTGMAMVYMKAGTLAADVKRTAVLTMPRKRQAKPMTNQLADPVTEALPEALTVLFKGEPNRVESMEVLMVMYPAPDLT